MLYYYMIQNSNDDLKEKAKKALKKWIWFIWKTIRKIK